MAGILVVLRAVGRLPLRDLRTFSAAGTNNFFLFCFLLLQQSGAFLQLIVAILLLFPLSVDPLKRVPRSRWTALAVRDGRPGCDSRGSFALSPEAWIRRRHCCSGWRARPWGCGSPRFRWASVRPRRHSRLCPNACPESIRYATSRPCPGRFDGLVRKDIREMLSLLDPYCELILAISGAVYRVMARHPEPDAIVGVTLLIVFAVSTYANLLLGLTRTPGSPATG